GSRPRRRRAQLRCSRSALGTRRRRRRLRCRGREGAWTAARRCSCSISGGTCASRGGQRTATACPRTRRAWLARRLPPRAAPGSTSDSRKRTRSAPGVRANAGMMRVVVDEARAVKW
ncbi:unnamed protein product, partial [Laminaria digitata]